MAEALREYDNNVVLKLCWEQSLNEAGNPLRNSKGNLVFKCGFQGCTVTRASNSGMSNLLNHTVEKHMESLKELYAANKSGSQGPMVQFVSYVSPVARKIYGWMKYVILTNQSLNSVMNKDAREFSKFESIDKKTMSKYLERVFEFVKLELQQILPQTFGIIFDGWSCSGEHFLAVFFTFVNKSGGVEKRLVSFNVQDLPENGESSEDFGFTAEDIGDCLNQLLTDMGRTWQSVEFLSGDNTSVNPRLANLVTDFILREYGVRRTIPLVGCASHRLNLAVQSLYEPGTVHHDLLKKVNEVMNELNTLKNRYRLATVTNLIPTRLHEIRWGGALATFKKYLALEEFLDKAEFPRETRRKFLDSEDVEQAGQFVEFLSEFERVNIHLQTDDAQVVSIHIVRCLFDKLIRHCPEVSLQLAKDSRLVHCPNFENGIAKIQSAQENTLTAAEKAAVEIFKIHGEDLSEVSERRESTEDDIVAQTLAETQGQVAKRVRASKYRSTAHVSPTSCICEQSNSQAKQIMTDCRRQMDPSSLNMIMVLKLNKDLWDARTVQKCTERASADATAHVPAAGSITSGPAASASAAAVSSSSSSSSSVASSLTSSSSGSFI